MAREESIQGKGTVIMKVETEQLGGFESGRKKTSSMTAVAQAGCAGIMMRAVTMGESKTRHL